MKTMKALTVIVVCLSAHYFIICFLPFIKWWIRGRILDDKSSINKSTRGEIYSTDEISREDVDRANHLVRNGRRLLKLSFDTTLALA